MWLDWEGRGGVVTVDLVNVFDVASVFFAHEASSSVTHPEMHGCFVVFVLSSLCVSSEERCRYSFYCVGLLGVSLCLYF